MNNSPSQETQDAQRCANFVEFVLGAWVVSIEVFIRRFFGEHYIGFKGPAVLVLVPLFTLVWKGYDVLPLTWFMGFFLCMCVCARAGTAAAKRLRILNHSRYSGEPILGFLFPRLSEKHVKQFVEPVFVASIGGLICQINKPLGWYLVIGAGCMFLSMRLNGMYWDRRAGALNDAVIEQQYVAERFRELRGENY